MARPLVLSNGELHVRFDRHGLVGDVYFPYVGLKSHASQTKHRIGVWVDGVMHWTDGIGWTHRSRYLHGALIGSTVVANETLGILLELEDLVSTESSVLIRNIHVVNIRDQQRSVRLFLHQAFDLRAQGADEHDTAQLLPGDDGVLHYNGRRAFVAGGMTDIGQAFDQYSIGRYGDGLDGTWRDADDGELSMSTAESGLTDSVLGFSLMLGGLSSRRVHYWLAAGTSTRAAISLAKTVRKSGVFKHQDKTATWWRRWLTPGFKVADRIPSAYQPAFIESVMRLQAATDRRGAITDGTAQQPYCSIRAGSYAAWPLVRMGYEDEVLRFLTFCRQALTDEGYVMSGYHPDGSVSATTQSYDEHGVAPIQSDQTALLLFVLSQVHTLARKPGVLKDFYAPLVVPMANFLTGFTDELGLPYPSFDRRDESRHVTAYTIALTYASLAAAAELAEEMKDASHAVKWRTAAEDMRQAAGTVMYTPEGQIAHAAGVQDVSIEGLFGAFMFGLVAMQDDTVSRTAERLERELKRDDGLFVVVGDPNQIDCIGSLWMAQYYMEIGKTEEAESIISAVIDLLRTRGTEYRSTWLHAELLSTLIDLIGRQSK